MAERDAKGRFGKGNKGKPKGATHKDTTKIKAAVRKFVEDNIQSLQDEFDTLEPRDKINFIEKLLKYYLPIPKEEKDDEKPQTVVNILTQELKEEDKPKRPEL